MTAISAWRGLFTQTVTISPYTGQSGYGVPTYGAGVVYRARVVGKHRLARDLAGKEVVSTQTVYLQSNKAVDPKDKVTLSTGDAGSTEATRLTPPLISVGRYRFERGAHHSVLFLQ